MSKKNTIIIITILTCVILAGIFIMISNREEDRVSNLSEAIPTSPPDSLPYIFMLNGNLIEMAGNYHQISPSIQEKIENAEFLGLTVDQVKRNEFPTEELQTNFVGKDCTVYYYKDEFEEAYIFIDSQKTNYCHYQYPQ